VKHCSAEVVWEHPDYGELRVFYRWEGSTLDGYRWVPFFWEQDLFTPSDEVERLHEEILSLRIDRPPSVSASEPSRASFGHGVTDKCS